MKWNEDWLDPIPSPPEGGRLLAALWTSYRPVSPEFMADQVLSRLVDMKRPDGKEESVRTYFIAEAMNALEPLRGKLTVITSPPITPANSPTDSWLWHYVTPYRVGKEGACIQHSKLWLCHWRTEEGEELLQMTISSTNLTPAGFNNQIQGAWSTIVPISKDEESDDVAKPLVKFIEALGASSNCEPRTKYWSDLLKKAQFPKDIHFVASIPGKPSPLEKWPFKKCEKLKIITPSIGEWSVDTLTMWCNALLIDCKKKVALILPDKDHPWVACADEDTQSNWQISQNTIDSLKNIGAKALALPTAMPIFVGGAENDPRWGHLKLYQLDNNLLIGSHNFSISAWGIPNDKKYPSNFELSVVVPNSSIPCAKKLSNLEWKNVAIAPPENNKVVSHWLIWANAEWDGNHLTIEINTSLPVEVHWHDGKDWNQLNTPPAHQSGQANFNIEVTDKNKTPRTLRLSKLKPDESVYLPVIDTRESSIDHPLVPVGTPENVLDLADQMLLESYGGPLANSVPRKKSPRNKNPITSQQGDGADYRCFFILESRSLTRIVDVWRDRFNEPYSDYAKEEGKRLLAVLSRRTEIIGARIAADELNKIINEASHD